MKKVLFIVAIFTAFVIAAPMAFAETSSQEGVTVSVAVGNVTATDDPFTYDASPNVGISIVTSATSYGITTANTLTGADNNNGSEFGTLSSATGYALRDKTTNTGTGPAAPSATALPTGTWAWMGGSGT